MESRWSKGSLSKLNTFDDTQQQQRIIAFAATENLTDLSASDRIYCDGTFYPCPSVFHQIYTIHIQIDGIMYPVIYALLPSTSEQVYMRFFNLVQRTMITNNLPFSPTTVFMDFERAAQNTIRSVCHGITIKGCNPLSMSWNYHQRLIFPLYTVYMAQSTDARSTNSIRGHHNIITQWIERDHTVWNHFNTEGPRTTNHIEACHGKVKKKVQHCHPNIYTIIQAFKDIQASNEIHRLQLQAGGTHQGSTETSTVG
jgi:hypothetical protein